MQNIVYVAHTRERDLKRARFSVLNMLHYAHEMGIKYRVIVYTDVPAYFSDLNVLVEEMDSVSIASWQGERQSKERIRIMAARDALATYHGNLILVQNEVFLIDSPAEMFAELSSNSSLMYEELGPFAATGFQLPDTIYYLPIELHQKQANKPLPAPAYSTTLFDMGLIAIHESDRNLLKKILCYHDALLAHLPDSLSATLAFSTVLGNCTFIQEANDWIDQYDKNSRTVDAQIQDFFKEHVNTPMHLLPSEAWQLSHQFDGSPKYSTRNIMEMVREIIQ